MEAPMLQVGGVNKEAIDAAADAVVRVATCSPTPGVAKKALEALMKLGAVNNITIENCTFTGSPSHNAAMDISSVPTVGSDYDFGRDENSSEFA